MLTSHVAPVALFGAALVWGGINVAADLREANTPPAISGYAVYSEPVRAGEAVLIPWTITKRVDCPGASSRVWNGQGGFHLSEVQQSTSLPVGEDMRFDIQTHIPSLAPVGPLVLEIIGFYDCDDERKSFTLGPVLLEVAG